MEIVNPINKIILTKYLKTKRNTMDKELKKLQEAFYTNNYDDKDVKKEYFIDAIKQLSESLNTLIEPTTKSLEEIVNIIYETDHVEALKLFLTGDLGFGHDLYFCKYYFDEGDWFDDNEEHEEMEREYGEEGYQYYHLYTKTKIHVFRELRPFPEGMEYEVTKERFK